MQNVQQRWAVLIANGIFEAEKAEAVNLTLKNIENLPCQTAADAFNSKTSSIATMRKYLEPITVKALLWREVESLLSVFSVGRGFTQSAIGEFIDFLISDYYFYKIEEFKTFFQMCKTGKFGKSYDRLDMPILCEWLMQYDELRSDTAIAVSKSNKGVPLSETKNFAPPPEIQAILDKMKLGEKSKKPFPTLEEFKLQNHNIVNYNFKVSQNLEKDTYDFFCEKLWEKLYLTK